VNFFGGALLDACINARQVARREKAFKLLAIERLSLSSDGWLRCASAIQTIKKIPSSQLMRLIDASSFSAWLELTESLLTSRLTWFSEQYSAWRAISREQLVAEQIEYIERMAYSMAGVSALQPKQPPVRQASRFEINADVAIDAWSKPLLANFSGMETMERLTDISKLVAFTDLMRLAFARIKTYNSKISDELQILVREVVPCCPAVPNIYPSGTSVFTPSAVYLAYTENVDIAAELLIHESGHLKFRVLDAQTPIVSVTDLKKRWSCHRWYSPWRDDPRSLMGIVHAIYVFIEVANYHLYRVKLDINNHTSRRRLHTLVYQLLEARKNNPIDPLLSEQGRLLFNEIDDSLGILVSALEELPQHEPTEPLYAERHKQWATSTLSCQQAANQHHAWYRKNYTEFTK
jgi:hypothetical protein